MPRRFSLFVIALCITAFTSLAQEPAITPKHSRHFTRYEGCEFVPTKYADGDSFKVRIGADEFVLRLYYVDAPESDERLALDFQPFSACSSQERKARISAFCSAAYSSVPPGVARQT